ncbi:MAG: hypothetical protein ABI693_18090 [Bryobacteraceae bacterium]
MTVIEPPVPLIMIPFPEDDVPTGFNTEIEVPGTTGETVALIVATTPFEIRFELVPTRIHNSEPDPDLHVIVLPAAVAAGPATATMFVMSVEA